MLYQSLLVVLLGLFECSFSYSVESVVVRLSKPLSSDDYSDSADGSYNTGDTLSIDSLSTSVYFCAMYSSPEKGQLVNIMVEGMDSGAVRGPSDKEIPKDYSSYRRYYGTSMNSFAIDSQLKVTAVIKDTSGNIISSKSILVNLEISLPNPDIVSFIARYSPPVSSDDYLEGSDDSIDISTFVPFVSSSETIYFAEQLSNLNSGDRIEVVMTGLDSGVVKTYSKDIPSMYSGYRLYNGISINSFGSTNYNLKVKLTIYNSDSSPVSSDSMTINYGWLESMDDHETVITSSCEESSGQSDSNCESYNSQTECENAGCEWMMSAIK